MAAGVWRSVIKLKGCLIILILMALSFVIFLYVLSIFCLQTQRLKTSMNMDNLYIVMSIYARHGKGFPKVTPEGGNGVRDLYPLYTTGVLNDEALSILQPPGCNLQPFSDNPTIDEFDKKHIGFSYNSTAIPDDPDNPPLLADQGVWSGRLQNNSPTPGIQSREEAGALVLFGDGKVEFINAYMDGTLHSSKVSSIEWQLLKDEASTNGYCFNTFPLKERHKNLKKLCALSFIAFIAFICILYAVKIGRTRIKARNRASI